MKVLKDIGSIGIADVLGSGITAIFWFVIAALLMPKEYGEIQYFISIAGIAYTISLIGTGEVMSVYTAKKIQLQSTLLSVSLIAGTISSIIILILFSKVDVSFLLIAYIINDLSLGYLLGKKLFSKYAKYVFTQKSLTFGIGILFYFMFGTDGIIFGIMLSYIHFLIMVLHILKSTKINFSLLKSRIGFVGNNYFIRITGIAKNNLDKIIIAPIIGFESLGNYALALQAYAVFMMFSHVVYKYILPHDSVGEITTRIKIIALCSSILIALLGVTITPLILPIVFPEYIEAVIAIQIISLAVIPSTITLILTSKLLGAENSKILLTTRIIFAVTITALIIILTPTFGIIGTTSAFVIAAVLQAVILFTYYQAKLRNVE